MTKTTLDFTHDEAAKLSNHHAAVMVRLLDGWTYEQIAAFAGCAIGTVKSRVNRARIAIKRDREPRDANEAGSESPRRSQTSVPLASKSNPPDADK